MIIELARLPGTTEGIHGPGRNRLPPRSLFLAPDAAKAFLALERGSGGLVYADMFRHADGVMAAREVDRATREPGFCPAGYGLAFELDVDKTLSRTRWTYDRLLSFLEEAGWLCLRRDRQRGPGDWSFLFLGKASSKILGMVDPVNQKTWLRAGEHAIAERWSAAFRLNPKEQQEALARLGLFHGEIDGVWGPLSRQARMLLERAYLLDGTDPKFMRVLAWAAAERKIVIDYSAAAPSVAA